MWISIAPNTSVVYSSLILEWKWAVVKATRIRELWSTVMTARNTDLLSIFRLHDFADVKIVSCNFYVPLIRKCGELSILPCWLSKLLIEHWCGGKRPGKGIYTFISLRLFLWVPSFVFYQTTHLMLICKTSMTITVSAEVLIGKIQYWW